jgi:hypothetical protein
MMEYMHLLCRVGVVSCDINGFVLFFLPEWVALDVVGRLTPSNDGN